MAVQAVYRAVGYKSDPVHSLPWDENSNVLPNVGGRVLTEPTADGIAGVPGTADPEAENRERLPGVYTTGWVPWPVGLIGNTKGDANEAVANLLEDHANGIGFNPSQPEEEAVDKWLAEKASSTPHGKAGTPSTNMSVNSAKLKVANAKGS